MKTNAGYKQRGPMNKLPRNGDKDFAFNGAYSSEDPWQDQPPPPSKPLKEEQGLYDPFEDEKNEDIDLFKNEAEQKVYD